MTIYNKYIVRTIIPILGLLTIVLTGLVWVAQILNFSNLLDKGISLKDFLQLTILLIPYLLYTIAPIITVLAIIYSYSKLQEERQVTIFRAIGLSNYKIMKPAIFVALVATAISFYISGYLLPVSYSKLKNNLSTFKEAYVSNIIETKTFNQVSKYTTLYVDKKKSNKVLEGVILFDNKYPDNRTIFLAGGGVIRNQGSSRAEFELFNGVRHSFDKKGNLTKLYFDNLVVEVISDVNIRENDRDKKGIELFLHEMLRPDKNMSRERQEKLIVDGHLRLIWPLFNVILPLLALSSFLNFPHNRRSHKKQYLYTLIPVMSASYIHFTSQTLAYNNLNYIFLCYANVFICIIFSIWQNIKNKV